jgi:hypothetical protein
MTIWSVLCPSSAATYANLLQPLRVYLQKYDRCNAKGTGGGIGALRVMSLLTPTRIPVGFALARDRVTPNPETEKHSFHRFQSIPDSTGSLAARCEVRSSDADNVTNRT